MLRVLRFRANLYLLEGGLLVDAGLPWEAPRLLGLLPEPPKALFLTHHHLDHAGGARALWERFRLPIYAHPLDLPYLTGERPRPPLPIPFLGHRLANAAPSLPPEALTPVEEGAEVFGLKVVHLPGHTPGQAGLLGPDFLIAGDALRGRRPGLPPGFVSEDPKEARRTLAKILRLAPRRVYVGHGGPYALDEIQALARRLGVA